MLIVDKHCSDVCRDEFAVPQINQNFICNQYGEKSLFGTPKISKVVDE